MRVISCSSRKRMVGLIRVFLRFGMAGQGALHFSLAFRYPIRSEMREAAS